MNLHSTFSELISCSLDPTTSFETNYFLTNWNKFYQTFCLVVISGVFFRQKHSKFVYLAIHENSGFVVSDLVIKI